MTSSSGPIIRRNWLISIFTIQALVKCLSVFLIFSLLFFTGTAKYVKAKDFDYLILSQRWLPTSCIEYEEKGSRFSFYSHYCTLPKNYQFWAIHGLWPTKNSEMGPFFCNSSMPFNVDLLKDIRSDLEVYWPNIEGGKDVASLWQHEWSKHGTCAAQLEILNNELKYFNTTLSQFKMLKLEEILSRYNFLPSNFKGLDVSDLFYVLQKVYGKNPYINCINEVKTHLPYLSEIRLCYNKNMELIDCENVSSNWGVTTKFTNCPLDHKVIYPDVVNSPSHNKASYKSFREKDYYDVLLDALHIIKFLQWASI